MSFLWQFARRGVWEPVWLRSRVCHCAVGAFAFSDEAGAEAATADLATLVQVQTAASSQWVLIGGREGTVHRNGSPLLLDIAVLRHRDHILVVDQATGEQARFYFSEEQPAVVEPLPGGLSPVCPRCKQRIAPGSDAVRCPQCGVWHHHGTDSCWAYTECCAACREQPTALDGQLRWSPEGL